MRQIPKTRENLRRILLTLIANSVQDSIILMFCTELEVSDNSEELEHFCNHNCEFHKLPLELYCFPHSAKEELKEKKPE